MCGIIGFQTKRRFKHFKQDMPNAVASLAHRGPDDTGVHFDTSAGLGLGHRRLSIIDLSASGHQPMISEDGKVIIVYNGEVYNFKEIRKDLKKRGHVFHSATDTEVVLKAYMQWGIKCLDKLTGMFAFAVWHHDDKTLILARDRMGIKPLYYYHHQGVFLFASELKALSAFRHFHPPMDDSAISLLLHYQYIPAPRSIFKHTRKVQPGHYVVYKDGVPNENPYWRLPGNPQSMVGKDEKTVIDQLDRLITRAVSDRLMSDVPLGALLSGGIDSSLVTAIMQKVNPAPVKTFSIGFQEKAFNEAPWASLVAGHLKTDHTELVVTPKQALDVVPRLPEIYDEPFADSSAIPTFLISQLTRSRVTVALSGDGGDEQFCGYVRYWSVASMNRIFQYIPEALRSLLALLLKRVPGHLVAHLYHLIYHHLPQRFQIANFNDKWQKLTGLMHHVDPSELYRMTIQLWSRDQINTLIGKNTPDTLFERGFAESSTRHILDRLMYVDQSTYLPDAMLTKVDRASMAAGLEIRVPLLDHRIVSYSAAIPHHLKYRNGSGKYILKKLLSRYVPNHLFERPKMGFGVPLDQWLRNGLKELLLDYLSADRLKREGLFNPLFVDEKIREHLSGRANHHHRLWVLLMWEMWRERWCEN